jgi:hypothetical protein
MRDGMRWSSERRVCRIVGRWCGERRDGGRAERVCVMRSRVDIYETM